uniref:Helitron helicase-like domain-containing protein n=1 Tax=Oryza glaberrima TaxID=4538 RepID=I1QTU1_ORYGL
MDANGSPVEGRFVFGDITNRLNVRQTTPCNEVENKKGETSSKKREYRARKKVEANNPYHEVPIPDKHIAERNIKQREYCARKNSVIEDAHNPITPAKPTEPTACVSVNHETGNSQPTKMSNEQREERNRKQHEYRKWKRDEMNNVDISVLSNIPMQPVTISSSMQSDGGNICRDEKREKDRNRKQCEYRARKKAESNNAILANFDATTPIIGSSFGTTYSTILQASSVTDNKNGNIDDPTDWLHRNDTYKRQCKRKPVIIEEDKDSPTIDGVTQEETIHVQDAKVHIPDDTYVEFDSGLFEPPLIDFVDEDHGATAEIHDIADNVDELDMQFQQSSQGPRHMQLYFYYTKDADALAHRVRRSPDLDINLVRVILCILAQNPYVQTFSRVGSMPNIDDYMIELNTNVTPDQRRYNAPTASQVAAIWLEGDNPMRTFDRHVLVHAKGDKPCYIQWETEWNLKMPYNDPNQILCDVEMDEHCETSTLGDVRTNEESTFDDLPENEVVDNYLDNEDDNDDSSKSGKGKKDKFVTAREYYCFRLQFRRGLLNIILFGGRLFQQWVVAMYIKIESMRLDWYSKPENQKKIRAELYQGVVDVLSSGETSGLAVGKRVVLPRTFSGGDSDMQ